MDYSQEQFERHIKEMVNANEAESERPLSLDELKELANSMGLTDEDWKKLLIEADTQLKMAEKHLKARNYVDAVASAEKATAINPYLKDGNSVMAQSYLMQWLDDNDTDKRDKAEFYARKELKVDANDQRAINVLSTIQNKKRVATEGKGAMKKLYYAIGGVVLILIIVGFFMRSGQSDKIENQLIEAHENVESKWGDVQATLDRRNKLIPDLLQALSNENPDLNKEISNLQAQIETAEGEEKMQLEKQLDDKIIQAKLLVNKNGAYKDNLVIEIEGAENRINFARKEYNKAVKSYNILVKKNKDDFPDYKTKPYFE